MKSSTKTRKLLSLAISLACATALNVSASAAAPKDGDKAAVKAAGDCKKCPKAQAGKKSTSRETKKCESHQKQCKSHQTSVTDKKHSDRKTLPPEAQKFVERMRGFHQEIGQLYRDGKRDEAREVTQQLREFVKDHAELARQAGPAMRAHHQGQHPGHHPPRVGHGRHGDPATNKAHDEARRRLELLAQAAEKLDQAGLTKEAQDIRHQAQKIERELQASAHHRCPHGQQLTKEVQELRKMLEQMKKEIAALKKGQRKKKH
ncbi:MAG: hypothetical protein L3J39_17735 [Verrucomicrobiales bacterium]|nr:hypothetical protein [Verrucomicrobiales bacterium]